MSNSLENILSFLSNGKTKKSERKWNGVTLLLGATIIFYIFFLCVYLYKDIFDEKENLSQIKVFSISSKINEESKFIKEGKLTFLSKKTKKKIITIDIEIADTPFERAVGLMYRRSMPAKAGMLFIYKQSKPQQFWMKNTYIPLDVIFMNENMQIVTIQKNKEPLSNKVIPSYKNSLYVVEVNAGFCDKYGITVGDYIDFKLF